MIIDWLHFLSALLLLWLPRQALRWGRTKLRWGGSRRRRLHDTNPAKAHEQGDPRVNFRAEIAKLRNHIDFFRAALGSVMLLGTFEGIEAAVRVEQAVSTEAGRLVTMVQVSVLLVGVLIQVIRYEQRVSLYAPIFYLSGLTVGMCGLYPALFSLVLVWAINLAFLGPGAFLSVHALLVLTFGVLFGGLEWRLPFVAAGLLLLPVGLSLLSRRRLGMFTKRMKA